MASCWSRIHGKVSEQRKQNVSFHGVVAAAADAVDRRAAISMLFRLTKDGQAVGTVTSVAPEPSGGILKGLGYVKAANAAPGTRLEVSGQENASADIITLAQPFGPAKG